MIPNPFDGRTEMTAAELLAWLAAGSPETFIPPAPETPPSWQTSEKAFMAKVVEFATDHGWLSYHTHKSANSAPGFPDLVMVRGDRLVFAELKVPPNKPTAAQHIWLEALIGAGVETYVWTPADWLAIEAALGTPEPAEGDFL